MEMYVESTIVDKRDAVNQPSRRAQARGGARITVRQAAAMTFALALGLAIGLVFRGTENLGFLEWVMVLLAISAMAVGYCVRGMEFEGDEARPLPRRDERTNVIPLASRRAPVAAGGSSREQHPSVSRPLRTSGRL
jgi:hypothetical protein